MKEQHKKILSYVIYSFLMIVLFVAFVWLGKFEHFQDFITKIEASSFDLRQTIVSKYKKANSNIVIIAVDDATYEYIMDKYGTWPISRKVWSDVIENVEQAKPQNIIFDMLFLKPDLNNIEADKAFIESVKNNENVYLSMNFDYYDDRVRKSPILEDKFKLNIEKGELKDNAYVSFTNARTVMKDLSDNTDNIGIINVTRDSDGIIRNTTPIFKYKGDYYPNLSLKVAMDLFKVDKVDIVDNSIVLTKQNVIPLDSTQRAILNWYGGAKTYEHIPLWEVIDAIKNNNAQYFEKFKDKIIYIGTTTTSLSDIKSVPTESNLAGVELHATFINNILDNNFIVKTTAKTDLVISILLCLIVGYCVLMTSSVLKTFVFLAIVMVCYGAMSVYMMMNWNLWVGVILPYISMTIIFILTYCEKYLLKSKDYEQTYRLAVTDGLTQLYNHRYFQEQMINNVNNFKRYGSKFSLILIDIDFFKKFNDTYGHQSGDCVLKQVANILKKNSRTSDIVCRYGGEEMAIILTNTDKADATITANKVCLAVRNNKFTLANNEKVNVTISVGVSTVGINGEKPQEIIEFADKCLYIAKENGRNQVVSETD
ncbi:MAG: diguanylate cyclase [Candidatus Gastranaerophilales bacterium]|nr:diguanylate cyclase [Candidatus Gastranaerophilales bacterium]